MPGFSFANAINSLMFFTGSDGCTTSTRSVSMSGAIGVRSRISWYGFLPYSVSFTVWVPETISSV